MKKNSDTPVYPGADEQTIAALQKKAQALIEQLAPLTHIEMAGQAFRGLTYACGKISQDEQGQCAHPHPAILKQAIHDGASAVEEAARRNEGKPVASLAERLGLAFSHALDRSTLPGHASAVAAQTVLSRWAEELQEGADLEDLVGDLEDMISDLRNLRIVAEGYVREQERERGCATDLQAVLSTGAEDRP